MRLHILLSLSLLLVVNIRAQAGYQSIDERSASVPGNLRSYEQIARHLTQDLVLEKEKARAIYIWISHNIRYDLSQVKSPVTYSSSDQIIKEVMQRRRGVCQHYSELFHAMSGSAGLKSYVIGGYTRQQDGKISNLSHAWNAVVVDSEFYLIDVTWAAGHVTNNRYVHKFQDDYFLIPPRDFIKTHMPFDPLWQFLDNPLTNGEFIGKDFSRLQKPGEFMFADSIAVFESLSLIDQLELSNRRITESGIKNNLIREQVNENSLHIAYARFNKAIDALNYGIKYYNQYVRHKNRQFSDVDSSVIGEWISNAEEGFSTADQIFRSLVTNNRELNDLIRSERRKMPELLSSLEKEKQFLENFLRSSGR